MKVTFNNPGLYGVFIGEMLGQFSDGHWENSVKHRNDWPLFKKEETNYVFLNKFGNKISERSVELILQEKGRKLRNPKDIYPHMIRHSYASMLLESGADLRVIQELLGHTSLQATQVYTSLSNFLTL